MNEIVSIAINDVTNGDASFCKFISANDSGETGGHQYGILISLSARKMFFNEKDMKENHILKHSGEITWQNDFSTGCTFTWYESKKEIRITGFGRGFDLLNSECTGDLFVLIKINTKEYKGYIFDTDDDIQDFLEYFGLTPTETNRLIEVKDDEENKEKKAVDAFISSLKKDFPTTEEMACAARRIQYEVYMNRYMVKSDPDTILIKWIAEEFYMFKVLECVRYEKMIKTGFEDLEDFISVANQVLNRRKTRAGKSLEHHLAAIFDEHKIKYSSQSYTEGKKKPDFIFPSIEAYHDCTYPLEKLCSLSAKTTCKDRWRQILNEANRLKDENKYLCTLQQGVSANQMDEMDAEKVILVVPKMYIGAYPKTKRDKIWTLSKFVEYIKETQS